MDTAEYRRSGARDGKWREAHQTLLENARLRPFVSQHELSAYTILRDQRVHLPAYVPYIGPAYFQSRPRILCYTINQNLSPHVRWTREWVDSWARDMDHARDRLNREVLEGRAIPIRPYAEGFVPLVALIAGYLWMQDASGKLPDCVDDVIAATNFVKFSTVGDASSSSIPAIWWRECAEQYAKAEITVLRPDIIIAFGQKTELEVRRVLKCVIDTDYRPLLLGCRFPARIPSIRARPLTTGESAFWETTIAPLMSRMRRPPATSYHHWKIARYPGYFLDIARDWKAIS